MSSAGEAAGPRWGRNLEGRGTEEDPYLVYCYTPECNVRNKPPIRGPDRPSGIYQCRTCGKQAWHSQSMQDQVVAEIEALEDARCLKALERAALHPEEFD